MFLTPDGAPFFGGTYFPKDGALRPAGFRRPAAARRRGVSRAGRRRSPSRARGSSSALASLEPARRGRTAPRCRRGAQRSRSPRSTRSFDPRARRLRRGAEVPAPDRARVLPARVTRCAATTRRSRSSRMTLARMADGGIHDQLGGGFCRYSVDAEWTIPHFEKMLYDNGPLLGLYADPRARHRRSALRATSRAASSAGWCARCARRTARSTRASTPTAKARRASSTSGRRDEVRALLDRRRMGGRRAVTSGSTGRRISRATRGTCASRCRSPRSRASSGSPLPDAAGAARRRARRAVRRAREARAAGPRRQDPDVVERARDRRARARRARARRAALGRPAPSPPPMRCARTLWRDGRLLATRRTTAPHLNAYLDDHAFLLAALLELMQTRSGREDFAWASELADALLDAFEDREHGGFFFTEPRPRDAVPPPKPGPRQRDAVGQRRRRAGADRARPPCRASRATSTRPSARVRLFAPALARAPGGCSTLLDRARGHARRRRRRSCCAATPATCAAWQRALERSYRPTVARLRPRRAGELAGGARQGRTAGARRRRHGSAGRKLPAAGRTRSTRSKRRSRAERQAAVAAALASAQSRVR